MIEESSDVTSNRVGAMSIVDGDKSRISLSTAFTTFLGLEKEDAAALVEYEKGHKAFHIETSYSKGETIFSSGDESDGFFVIWVVCDITGTQFKGTNSIETFITQ